MIRPELGFGGKKRRAEKNVGSKKETELKLGIMVHAYNLST
jgi:hypothetical protein